MAGRERPEPSLMHNIGAFFGHIVQAIREEPDAGAARARQTEATAATESAAGESRGGVRGEAEAAREASETHETREALEVRREVQEARHGEYLLRRTTIDEVIRAPEGDAGPADETGR